MPKSRRIERKARTLTALLFLSLYRLHNPICGQDVEQVHPLCLSRQTLTRYEPPVRLEFLDLLPTKGLPIQNKVVRRHPKLEPGCECNAQNRPAVLFSRDESGCFLGHPCLGRIESNHRAPERRELKVPPFCPCGY